LGNAALTQKITGIQAARGFAALVVVIRHTCPAFLLGSAGVDIFFVISGFVMVVSSEKLYERPGAWKIFLQRRIIRIVPLYWFITFIVAYLTRRDFEAWHILPSLFFIPFEHNGSTLPIVSPGWSLNLEMYFYAIFAVFLFLRPAWSALAVTVVISLPLLLRLFASDLGILITQYYANPIVLEFCAGMWLALLWRRGFRLSALSAVSLAIVALCIFSASVLFADPWMEHLWKLAAVLLVAAVAFGPSPPLAKVADFGGDISYSLYLSHYLIIIEPVVLWPTPIPLVLCVLLGSATHFLVERPMSKIIKYIWSPSAILQNAQVQVS
jgi:exopolysaccharide production protein ExoZ